jgi:hypothetical protein
MNIENFFACLPPLFLPLTLSFSGLIVSPLKSNFFRLPVHDSGGPFKRASIVRFFYYGRFALVDSAY